MHVEDLTDGTGETTLGCVWGALHEYDERVLFDGLVGRAEWLAWLGGVVVWYSRRGASCFDLMLAMDHSGKVMALDRHRRPREDKGTDAALKRQSVVHSAPSLLETCGAFSLHSVLTCTYIINLLPTAIRKIPRLLRNNSRSSRELTRRKGALYTSRRGFKKNNQQLLFCVPGTDETRDQTYERSKTCTSEHDADE